MKISSDKYSDFKDRINGNRQFIFHEPVNNGEKVRDNNLHSFIVEWQIPPVDIAENISLDAIDPFVKKG